MTWLTVGAAIVAILVVALAWTCLIAASLADDDRERMNPWVPHQDD